MKSDRFFRRSAAGLVLAAFTAALLLSADAVSTTTTTTHHTTTPPKKHTTAHWLVSAVNPSNNTVELGLSDQSSNLTVHVTSATRITVNGKAAKMSDLQKDMRVTVHATAGACSSIEAVTTDTKKKTK